MKKYDFDIFNKIFVNEADLGYKCHNNISDDDIWYYWGYKDLVGYENKKIRMNKKKIKFLNKINFNDRNEVINFAKNKYRDILPDKLEFIKREYWTSFNDLIGKNIQKCFHPVLEFSKVIIRNFFKPNSDTILIQNCANTKPYIDNHNFNFNLKLHKAGYFDLWISSSNLTPIEFSVFYPYRHYDWGHNNSTELDESVALFKEYEDICETIVLFNYKKIILQFPTYLKNNYYLKLCQLLKQTFSNRDIQLVVNQELADQIKADVGIGMGALVYPNLNVTRNKIKQLVNCQEEGFEKFKNENNWFLGRNIKNYPYIKELSDYYVNSKQNKYNYIYKLK